MVFSSENLNVNFLSEMQTLVDRNSHRIHGVFLISHSVRMDASHSNISYQK